MIIEMDDGDRINTHHQHRGMKGEGGTEAYNRVLTGCVAEEIERFGEWRNEPGAGNGYSPEAQLAADEIALEDDPAVRDANMIVSQRNHYAKLTKRYKEKWRRAVKRVLELEHKLDKQSLRT